MIRQDQLAHYYMQQMNMKKNLVILIYLLMQATEPLRPKDILTKCINLLLRNKKLNSAFAAYEYKKFLDKK